MGRGGWALGVALAALIAGCGDDGAMDAGADAGRDGGGPGCSRDDDCDDGVFCDGVERCDPGSRDADARGCVEAPAGPCVAGQRCDEAAARCATECAADPDADGDGHDAAECGGDDCDDSDRNRYPGNPEVCDAMDRDEDCDPETFGVRDDDGDGWPDARCCNRTADGREACGSDCRDDLPLVHPTLGETCDGLDNDCNGETDEGVTRRFFPDRDGDGFGDERAEAVVACEPPDDHVENAGDCDDDNGAAHDRAGPEICDELDNDCDGEVDEETRVVTWWPDPDGDGWGETGGATVESCLPVPGHAMATGDCDETDPEVNPGSAELCNGVDDNCDGALDGPSEDDDGDGHADDACAGAGGSDCDDTRATVYDGAPEVCDGFDSGCAMGGVALEDERDRDGDGYVVSTTCAPGPELSPGDCDDRQAGVHEGADEIACNGADDDCDGDVDEIGDPSCDGIVDIDAAAWMSCLVRRSGRVECWGSNTYGQLGDGTTVDRDRPVRVSDLTDAVAVAVSGSHSCALRSDRSVWCWGENSRGRLGDRTVENRWTPVQVVGGFRATHVAAGGHTCAIQTPSNEPHCWGDNTFGQLGLGVAGDWFGSPVTVVGSLDAIDIAVSAGNSCAVLRSGELRCWGANVRGEVGDGTLEMRPAPTLVLGISDAVNVEMGAEHACALLASGSVRCWGANFIGMLGSGSPAMASSTPAAVTGISDALDLDAGTFHTCMRRSDASTWCWGAGFAGQLGDGTRMDRREPVQVRSLVNARRIAAGEDHTCAQRTTGVLSCWGSNMFGQLAIPGSSGELTPRRVPDLP